jgi:hypothetical protein
MITKQALEVAEEIGAQRVLARYGLEKGAAGFFQNFGGSLRSGFDALGNSMTKGNWGAAPGEAWKAMGSKGRGVMRGVGMGLAGAGALYGASRMFGRPDRDRY